MTHDFHYLHFLSQAGIKQQYGMWSDQNVTVSLTLGHSFNGYSVNSKYYPSDSFVSHG